MHLERPGIEAHVPAWWVALARKGSAWAVPSAMNFSEVVLNPLELPFCQGGQGQRSSGEGLGKAVDRAILGAGPWPASDFGFQGWTTRVWKGLEVWEALGLSLPG